MESQRRNQWSVIGAIALIALGVWMLLGRLDLAWLDRIRSSLAWVAGLLWPLVLIALGVILLVVSRNGRLGPIDTGGRKLYRSRDDRMVAGVLGGLGEYLGIDPTWLRVLFVILGLMGALPAVVAYVVAVVLIPERPVEPHAAPRWPGDPSGTETVQEPPPAPPVPPAPPQ